MQIDIAILDLNDFSQSSETSVTPYVKTCRSRVLHLDFESRVTLAIRRELRNKSRRGVSVRLRFRIGILCIRTYHSASDMPKFKILSEVNVKK